MALLRLQSRVCEVVRLRRLSREKRARHAARERLRADLIMRLIDSMTVMNETEAQEFLEKLIADINARLKALR